MNTQDNNIDIFALTDSHQEARKLCCLFSGILRRCSPQGNNTLVCDCGDLFKGIYSRDLCVDSYLTLRKLLPQANICLAVGNNDFGFNIENFNFLQTTVQKFANAGIDVICANLRRMEDNKSPQWIKPYVIYKIGGKKIMLLAFCIEYVRLQKYGLQLINIRDAFLEMAPEIALHNPDAIIILNHALEYQSQELYEAAQQHNIKCDLIIGGHEHSAVAPNDACHIYYPHAFSRTMLHFNMSFTPCKLTYLEEIGCKEEPIADIFEPPLFAFEEKSGLNTPIAISTLDLPRKYSDANPLGTFMADIMKNAANADIAFLSTGYMTHSLRYEQGKMLTMYNVERAFSAEVCLQTVAITADELRRTFNNALRGRYNPQASNSRFLQCSQNITLECYEGSNFSAQVQQIYINNQPLFASNGRPFIPERRYICALDPYIASGEQGFEALKALPKTTLTASGKLVKIKDLFIDAIRMAPKNYAAGTIYPHFRIIDHKI